MPLIALSGGIAAGKSTIARRFAELGAIVVDADALVREVQAPGSAVLASIADAFGADVIAGDGSLRRDVLAARVFGDADAVARLNAIVHPAVREASTRRFEAAFADDPNAVVVYDVPLLAETRSDDGWDAVVIAHAPAEQRIERLIVERGFSEAQARARVGAQAGDAERLALADEIIDTSGTLAETLAQTDAVWQRLRTV